MNSNYWLDTVAGNIFKVSGTPALPGKLYIGLSKTHPKADGTGVTEPTTGGYSRVELKSLQKSATGRVTNGADVEFPESTQSQGVMTDWVVYDAQIGGHLLFWDRFRKRDSGTEDTRTVDEGTALVFRAGAITVWARDDDSLTGT